MKIAHILFRCIFGIFLLGVSNTAFAQLDITKNKVVFDITEHWVNNGYVEVAVSIEALINVESLDFSLKFGQPKLHFDTIINAVNYLQSPTYFYTNSTQTLRFTSYALQNYDKKKPIIYIRFSSDSARIDTTDLFSIKAYLNGDKSGYEVRDSIGPLITTNVRLINNLKEHLACGDQHTIALKVGGEVWAWGNNASGQLGDNSSSQSSAPLRVKGLNNIGFLKDVTAIAAGADHSLAVLCDGSVVAWGNNNSGQLGDGTNTRSLFPILVQGLPAGVKAFSIAAGDFHSVAVMEDGTVYSWGGNADGQLGVNSNTDALTAKQVHGIANVGFLREAYEVAAGGSHSLVLMRDSTVRSFGNALKGQTGNGLAGGTELTPVVVLDNVSNDTLRNVINVEAGNDHSIAALLDGTIKTWGGNASGQLGDGTTTDRSKAISVLGISGGKSGTAGFGFSGVILNSGAAWAWGSNSFGQLGDNTKGTNRLLPVPMHGIANVGFLSNGLSIAAGKEFSVMLFDENQNGLYCASGYNLNGQLGDSTLISKSVTVTTFGSLVAGIASASFSPLNGFSVCFPDGKVTFANTGSTGVGKTYFWNFGAGATPQTSILENPGLVTYANAGTKNIIFVVSEGLGCSGTWSDTARQSVNVIAGADANFTSSAGGCEGQGINFYSAGSKGTGVIHSWKFGVGSNPSISTDENPLAVNYAAYGAYTVTHTVFVATCGSASDSKTSAITVNPSPVASFTSTGSVCANAPVVFTYTGTSEPGLTCFWEFGVDAFDATSFSQTPNAIIYKSSGAKRVILNATNVFGCTTSISDTLLIKTTPKINLFNNSTTPLCTETPIHFSNSGDSTGVSFLWNFGNFANVLSDTLKNPVNIFYINGGTKTVTLNATDSLTGCLATATQILNVSEKPSANFISNASLCAGSKIDFSSSNTKTSSNGTWTYNWNFVADALPLTAATKDVAGVVYLLGGKKGITLSVSDGECSNSKTDTLVLFDQPIAFAGNDTSVCGSNVIAMGAPAIAGNSYSWIPSAGLNNAQISNPVTFPAKGFTNYILVATNNVTNCAARDTIFIMASNALEAKTANDQSICKYEEVKIGGAFVPGQTYTWIPSLGLNDTTAANPTANPDSTTTYTLVVNGYGCASVIDSILVEVHPLPKIYLGNNDTIAKGKSYSLEAGGGVSYSWSPAFALSNPGVFNPLANPDVTTTYTVSVTDIFGCTDTSSLTIFVQSNEYWIPKAFSPDANGKNDVLFVRGDGIDDFEFVIFNNSGELLYLSNNIDEGWNGKRQSTGELVPEGAYVYFVKGNKIDGTIINDRGLVNLLR